MAVHNYKPLIGFVNFFDVTRVTVTHVKYHVSVVRYDVGSFFSIFIEDEDIAIECETRCLEIYSVLSMVLAAFEDCVDLLWHAFCIY